jgi:two-component system nitrogen regulation sensor histidine kinase GlnL
MKHDQGILDSLSTGVIALDDSLRVTALNAAGQVLLETSESRAIGSPATDLVVNPEEWLDTLRQVLASKSAKAARSVSLMLHSGQEIHVDVIMTPAVDSAGAFSLLVELMAVDRLLKISRDENLQATQETSRAVIRGLAHEIKNPLGGVRGAAQLLARELPNEELTEYTRVIIHEADRLRDLVDRLLGPNRELELETLNIHEILEHVLDLINAEAGNTVTIIRDYDPSLPEVYCDRAQLIQAVLNIMRNALQAAESPEACEITIRSRAQRQYTVGAQVHRLVCRVDIIDNGPGIPEEILPAVFAPMVTSRAHGTGLGLSISQSIIHLHGGVLECDSRPGETRFTFYIPMEAQHEQAS